MKNQRWPGDNQTIKQEFASARSEEDKGMRDANASHGNDYLAKPTSSLDMYNLAQLEPSWSTQLDTTGMQPHAREFLERDLQGIVSGHKFHTVDGQTIDYCEGIHFGDAP